MSVGGNEIILKSIGICGLTDLVYKYSVSALVL